MRMSTAMRFFCYIIISINLHVYTAGLEPAVPDTLTPPRLAAHRSFVESRISSESDSSPIPPTDMRRNSTDRLTSVHSTVYDSPRKIEEPGTTPPSPLEIEIKSMQAKIEDEQFRYGSKTTDDRSDQLKHLQMAQEAEEHKKHLASVSKKRATLMQKIEEGGDPIAAAILHSDSKTTRKWSEDFELAPAFSPASSSSTSPASSATSSAYSSATPSAATSPKQSPSLGPVPAHSPLSGSPSDHVYRAPASPPKQSLFRTYIVKDKEKQQEKEKAQPKRPSLVKAALTSLSLSSPKNASPSSSKHF